ncbi:MAG: hypothetical protein CMF12_08560 [Idiomarina sp.]|uniref:hypothetical protein n=1 Tax=Idiomarina sp. TaxID=1874361 RepID=UPI000C4E47F7|nr:hypothetical protein [Idiomarina sp.]MBT42561.1 hypothetical protein [Idiomarina sp.]
MSDLNFFREQADSVIEFWGDDSTEALSDAEDYMMMHRALADAHVHFSHVGYGATFKHRRKEQWAFILPDVSHPGFIRYQSFDRDSFCGHASYVSDVDVLIEMIRHGYTIPVDKNTLIDISKTERWRIGSLKLLLLTDLNAGKITHGEYLEKIKTDSLTLEVKHVA